MFCTTADNWNQLLGVRYDTVSHEIEVIPIVNEGAGITLAKGEVKEKILQEFAQRNQELANGWWKDGWHAFWLSVQDAYKKTIQRACNEDSTDRANAKFAHYLDCEAHTDVWRELFPTYNQTNER